MPSDGENLCAKSMILVDKDGILFAFDVTFRSLFGCETWSQTYVDSIALHQNTVNGDGEICQPELFVLPWTEAPIATATGD